MNRIKANLKFAALLLATFGVFLASGCHRHDSETARPLLYTCGMHPQVVQDHPGDCPICGMKLTPLRNEANPAQVVGTASTDSSAIAVDPVTIQTMGIRTASVVRGPLRRLIRTVGVIDYNETALSEVTTKFKGWVEKLYVNATGQLVMRGDPLFEVYSPELYSAQREFLLALDAGINSPGLASLKTSALTKLKFYDISDEQIAELEQTRQPRKTLKIVAPQDGFVMEKAVVEGQMVEPGARTYRLADLGLVWVQAQLYEQDLPFIHLGQEVNVTLSYLSDREFRGRVTYIYPNIDEKTRTARVRMEFHNPGYFLKPGMFATVHVLSELNSSALLVPDMAILRSGEKNTVFVALDGGKFEPREVVLGPQAENDTYEIVSGLTAGERIVTSGQFMLDSESQLREAIQKMQGGRAPGASPGVTQSSPTNQPALALSTTNAVKYICPMPEHVSIEYDHPGKCPICGMTLVPVTQATLARLQPGGKLLYYTCPMPEHNDVRSDRPGKCPKCSMTLIPVMTAPKASDGVAMPENRDPSK
ncbi:MAG TPA: efflux RND transporter periplasmic adaptor subunit [Verrucomicrobiae bacterium]|nr:efflux RND transporter periplasmic adaptor subunit [Verrucomicrobiae bacterium]